MNRNRHLKKEIQWHWKYRTKGQTMLEKALHIKLNSNKIKVKYNNNISSSLEDKSEIAINNIKKKHRSS